MDRSILRLREHDDGVDRWRLVDTAPSAPLAGTIDSYCAYDERTTSFNARREPAAAKVVMLFNLGEPIGLTGADGTDLSLGTGEAFVAGFADGTSISRSTGSQTGIHVDLSWQTLARICGCPLAEIANRVVPLVELLPSARDLGLRLADSGSLEERFARLDAFFERRLAESPPPDSRLAPAVEQLRTHPATSIGDLATWIGWSPRRLRQRFRQATGLSPRRFARLARFERFTRSLAAFPTGRLADLAQDAGYFDQPHLVREVRTFSGMTPSEIRARMLPGGGIVDT